MNKFVAFANVLLRNGLYEFLSTLAPTIKIEKRAEQFLNLIILRFIDKLVKTSARIIHVRKGQIFQKKDLNFLIYLEKSKNFPNLKFFEKKFFKNKKKRKQSVTLRNQNQH